MDQRPERDHHAGERLLHAPLAGRQSIESGPGDGHVGRHSMALGSEGPNLVRETALQKRGPRALDNDTDLPLDEGVRLRLVWGGCRVWPHERPSRCLGLLRVVGIHGLHSVVPDEVLQRNDRLVRALGFRGGRRQ